MADEKKSRGRDKNDVTLDSEGVERATVLRTCTYLMLEHAKTPLLLPEVGEYNIR